MTDWAAAARRLVRGSSTASLATLSHRLGGYPFGSVVSFVPDSLARPVILMSGLAEHTANLRADARASLLVQQRCEDPQAAARVTLVCDARPLDADPSFVERHVRYLPQSARLLELGDFRFMLLAPVAVRFIAGFGAIGWVEIGDYAPPWTEPAESEARIIAAFRRENAELLETLAGTGVGSEDAEVELLGLDCDGVDLRARGERLRIDAPSPAASVADLARLLKQLTQ
jgi:putative heme iron utilization protein